MPFKYEPCDISWLTAALLLVYSLDLFKYKYGISTLPDWLILAAVIFL